MTPEPKKLTKAQIVTLLAPLVAVCAGDLTSDAVGVYHAVWKGEDFHWLKVAIAEYLSTATERWLPMPAVIASRSRVLKATDRQDRIAAAPKCPICKESPDGRVDVAIRANGKRLNSLACTCVRGESLRERGWPTFDPHTMEPWLAHVREAITGPVPNQVKIPDLSVPQSTNKPQRQQRKELARFSKDRN